MSESSGSDSKPSYLQDASRPSIKMTGFEEHVVKELESEFLATEDCREERIQTFLRIRPSNNNDLFFEKDSRTLAVQSAVNMNAKKVPNENSKTLFTFSKILGPQSTQIQVFDECVSSILEKFLINESCLIFGYGATNSGKTHTMQGYGNDFGIVPRTLEYIFNSLEEKLYFRGNIKPHMFDQYSSLSERDVNAIQETKTKILRESKGKWCQADIQSFSSSLASLRPSVCGSGTSGGSKNLHDLYEGIISSKPVLPAEKCEIPDGGTLYSLWVSFAELYNEKVYDLFDEGSPKKRKERKLMADKKGQVYIKDLTEVCVTSAEEAYTLFLAGKSNLKIAATEMNATSSRSHCFFTIRIITLGTTKGNVYPKQVRRISFCDLAGAERSSKTGNVGNRLKESGSINQSLLVLLRCFRAMRNTQQKKNVIPEFIPFRESKLTRLFQSYLTTASHVCMIVNINPDRKNFESTLQVLHNSAIASEVIAFRRVEPPINDSKFYKKLRESINIRESIKQRISTGNVKDNETKTEEERHPCQTVIAQSKVNSQDCELSKALVYIDRLKSENKKLKADLEKRDDEVGRLNKLLDMIEQQDKEASVQSEQYQKAVNLINEKRLSMQARILKEQHDQEIAELKNQLQLDQQSQNSEDYDTFSSGDEESKENNLNSFLSPKALSSSKVVDLEQKNEKIRELTEQIEELSEAVSALRYSIDHRNAEVISLQMQLKDKEQFDNDTFEIQRSVIKRLEEEVKNLKIVDASLREKEITSQLVGLNADIERLTKDNEVLRVELQDGQNTCLEYHLKLTEANENNEKLNSALNTALAEKRICDEEREIMHDAYEEMEKKWRMCEKHQKRTHESVGTSTTPTLCTHPHLRPPRRTNRTRNSPMKLRSQPKPKKTVSVGTNRTGIRKPFSSIQLSPSP